MKRTFVVTIVLISLIGTGCTSLKHVFFSSQTPLDDVIVDSRRAVVSASEKTLFEEFVKYKELGHTFALYKISEVNIKASTNNTDSSTEKAGIEFPEKLSASKDIAVSDAHGAEIAIKLIPVGNDPEIYGRIKEIFNKTHGKDLIYGLAYYDNSGRPVSEDAGNECKASYCIAVDGLKDSKGNRAFAYIKDVTALRELNNEIRELSDKAPPPKDKSSSCK